MALFMGFVALRPGHYRVERSVSVGAPASVAYRLEFLKPFESVATTEFALAPDGAGTRVSWSMEGDLGFFEKLVTVFIDMNGAIAGDFDRGLAFPRQVAERRGAR